MKSRKKFKKSDGSSKPSGNGDASMAYEEKEKIVLEGNMFIFFILKIVKCVYVLVLRKG